MSRSERNHIVKLFNEGVLTLLSAEWYNMKGYYILCGNGKVIDIIEEEE